MDALVTGVGSTTAQSVIKGIRRQSQYDIQVVGTDINQATEIAGSRYCDEFYQIPAATDEKAFVDALIDIVRSEDIDVVLPIVDVELTVLSKHAKTVRAETNLLLSDRETVEKCDRKIQTYEFFQSINVPTPKTLAVKTAASQQELASQVEALDFPLIAKPNVGVSSRDVYTIRNPNELCLLKRIDEPIIQERATGQEYTIDVFRDGEKTISVIPRKRLETRAGISYKGETVQDERLIEFGTEIANELGIYGPANIQCFKDGSEIQFFEINPRFSGSLPLSIEAGRNSVLYALQLAEGDPIEPVKPFENVRMCRRWSEVYQNVC